MRAALLLCCGVPQSAQAICTDIMGAGLLALGAFTDQFAFALRCKRKPGGTISVIGSPVELMFLLLVDDSLRRGVVTGGTSLVSIPALGDFAPSLHTLIYNSRHNTQNISIPCCMLAKRRAVLLQERCV